MESSDFNRSRKKRQTKVRRKQRMNQLYGTFWAATLTLATVESVAELPYVEVKDLKEVITDSYTTDL